MTARLQLDSYLDGARRRLQWILSAQGAALLLLALLAITLIAAPLLWRFAFTDSVAMFGRIALLLGAAGVGTWFYLRWRALRRDAGAAELERALPAQDGRVATYLQESARPTGPSLLIDLLAADALKRADDEPLTTTIARKRIAIPAAVAFAAVAGLAALFTVGGPWSEGARNLWLGRLPPEASIAAAAGGIAVKPGDATVRRNQDLAISAVVAGGAGDPQVHVRFEGSDKWEIAPMERDAKSGGYAFTLFALRDAASYYVSAGGLKSKEHRISVVDLPTVEHLRLTYEYPNWTGLPRRHEESGGDIRAVAGTRVQVEVVTSAPLTTPLLVINGSDNGLSQEGNTSRGNLAVKQEGHYRIATRFGDEIVPLTPDYAIELVIDEKPNVKIQRPGRDYRATNIEEVPVQVQATDDFRLEALELHYSVNGGEFQSEKLPAGSADIQAAALLRLEEMQQRGTNGESPLLKPGDLVSYYALAKDHQHSVQTDLFLIQVQPFELRYTQGQAGGGGGGGGGGDDDQEISKRQRDVLLATWNLQRNRDGESGREADRNADNARMLAEVQQTLAAQVTTLVQRAQARMLTGQDQGVNEFVKGLEEAAKAMQPAVKNLSAINLPEAIKFEQQALQHLLRAEATLRDIQVAQGQRGGGGGGGGSQAARDVSEMTELELDLEKNQYETERQMTAQQADQAEDEAMKRLQELARRQEQMAREAARQQQQPEASRWQQEQLRREAEELRRQLEQLAQRGGQQQNGQQSGQQSGQQGGQQSGSQQGGQQGRQQQSTSQQGGQQGRQQQSTSQQGGQQGQQQSAQASAAAEAARQVAQAMDQMRKAGDPESQRRASEQLNRAREQLERGREQAGRDRFNDLANQAEDLVRRQRESERELRAAIGNRPPASLANPNQSSQRQSGMTYEQMDRLASTKRQIQSDLDSLQRRIDTTRRSAEQDSPRAANELAQARQQLQEMDTVGSLERSARDIERGRGVQAASREAMISDTLERVQQDLQSAADIASNDGPRRGGREADAGDLLAELGDLRRALDRARQQAIAQNQAGSGQAGARSPNAGEGQQGQAGGQQGQQGQGGQGQSGEAGGESQGQQGGGGGNGDVGAAGGRGNAEVAGNGGNRMGGAGSRVRGSGLSDFRGVRPLSAAEREALRSQTRLSSERLAQLRQALGEGALVEADATALRELESRLARGGADPLSAEYQRMTALVNQLELSALKAQQAKEGAKLTRAGETVDDSRRYRDNVAEYYRRLGGGNE